MKKSCCTCCGPFKPRYQRLVDNIFPLNPNDGLVRNNMEKLTFFALSSPEKLDRIGEYLAKKLTRDVSRKRYGNIFIAMEALDQLLVACHAQTLNLFVESFLKMVQKLLECEEPDLNILATNSFVKFANIEEDAPSYHRRYDFFISKFASMCHNNSPDLRARLKIRKSGLRGIHAVVRKTVSDDLQVNIYELEHMKKIVPSLLFNMHDPSALEITNEGQQGTAANGASNSNDIAKEHRDKLNELAESCLRELVSKASYGTLKSLMKPLLTHFDSHNLWDGSNTFSVQVLRIIMYSVKPQHTHLVIDMMLAHLDKHAHDGKIRTNIMRAISQIITIATVSSIGPSIHQWFNKMLQDLKRSVDVSSPDPNMVKDEEEFQETLIHTMGEFATNLPDYQKIEVLMFIMSQVPVPLQNGEPYDGYCNFLGVQTGPNTGDNVSLDKRKKSNIFFPKNFPQPQTVTKGAVGLNVRQDGKGRFITEPVAEGPQLIVSSPTEDEGSSTRDVKELSGSENDPKSPYFIAQNLPGDTYPLVAPSPGPGVVKVSPDRGVASEKKASIERASKALTSPGQKSPQIHKAGGNTRLQMMVLHSLLKVATKYKSIQYSTTFPSAFLIPLLRMSIVQDAHIRLLVQQILHTLLDRHDNLEIFIRMEPVDYDVNNASWSQLRVEKPSHLDNLFARKSGALFYSALYDSALRLNNGPDNIKSLIITICLLAVEIGNEDVIFDLIRLMFALQKKCREYPFLRGGPAGNKKNSSVGVHKNSLHTSHLCDSLSTNVVLDSVKHADLDRQTTYSDSVLKEDVDDHEFSLIRKGDEVFCLPALSLEFRVHAAVECVLSFLLLQIARVFDPDNPLTPEDNSFAFAVKDSPLAKMATKLTDIYVARGRGNVSRLTLPQVALASSQPKSEPESPTTPTLFENQFYHQEDQMPKPIPGMPYPIVLERSCKELLDDDTLFYRVDTFKELFRELGVDCGKLDESLTLKSLITIVGVHNDPTGASPQLDNRSLSIASSSRSNSFFFDTSSQTSSGSKSPAHSLTHKLNDSTTDGWLKSRRKTKISYNDINVASMKRVLSREKTRAEKDARELRLKQLCEWYQTAPFEEIITNTRCNEVEYRKQMRTIIFQNITRSTRSFYDEPKYPPYLGSQKMLDGAAPKFHQPTSLLEMKFPRLIVY